MVFHFLSWNLIPFYDPYFIYTKQMEKTSAKECKKRWEKIKSYSSGVNSPKSHPMSLTIRGQKRAELPEANTQNLGWGPFLLLAKRRSLLEAIMLRLDGAMLAMTSSASKVRTSIFLRSSLLSTEPFVPNPSWTL